MFASPKGIFRSLVILSVVWWFVSVVVFVVSARSLPAPLHDYMSVRAHERPFYMPPWLNPWLTILIGLSVVVSAATLAIAIPIGLYRFRPWARTSYVAIAALSTICLFWSGPFVCPSATLACFEIGSFIQGALITAAFLPPFAPLFATHRT
jgi:hypothetical protein